MKISKQISIVTALVCTVGLPINTHAITAHEVGHKVSDAISAVDKETMDTAITAKIRSLLTLESDIKSLHIEVNTKNKVVHLKGDVDTALQADKIIALVQSVDQVQDIIAQIVINKSNHYTQDALVTAKVKGKILQLANDHQIVNGKNLQVETHNGVVHIFGSVAHNNDIPTIKKAVHLVNGVSQVNTNIEVKK